MSNKYIVKDNYAELIITNKNKQQYTVLIDVEDIEKCKQMQWSITKRGYVRAQGKISLHRYITLYNGPLDIDHINRNKLDNRKLNLRIADKFTNNQNNNKTGVFFDNHANKWRAEFHRYGRYFYAGIFSTKEEALKARENLIKEIDKEKDKYISNYKEKKIEKHVGVRPSPHGRWLARFCADNKVHYVGTYDTEEEAIIRRQEAIEEYNKLKISA